jgi:hypothetical protein
VQKFRELISKMGDNEHHRWGNDMVLDVTNVQGDLAAMGSLLEVKDGQRVKKSFATWAISFFGLWNFWSIKSVEGRLKHTKEAVQLTAKRIDYTIQFAAENEDNIQKIERNLLESNRRSVAKWFWVQGRGALGGLEETGTKLHEDRASIFSSPTFAQNYGVH